MFKKAPTIAVGDSFIKVGGSRKVWTVVSIAATHARLASLQRSPDMITISVSALADRSLFQPLNPELPSIGRAVDGVPKGGI